VRETLTLSSGRCCVIVDRDHLLYRYHHVLFFPSEQGAPSEAEKDEMLVLTRHKAREYGQRIFGDPECYTVIHNGLGAIRVDCSHFHIVPVRNRYQKAFFYLFLFMKNALSGRRPV
jgi:hypothetical protein